MPSIIYSDRFIGTEMKSRLELAVPYNFKAQAKKVTEVLFKYAFFYEEDEKRLVAEIANDKSLESLIIKKVYNDKENKLFKVYIENFGQEVVLIKKDQVFGYLSFSYIPKHDFEPNPS